MATTAPLFVFDAAQAALDLLEGSDRDILRAAFYTGDLLMQESPG